MDKGKLIENLIREGHEKGGFTGAWLYAEHGEIISKGAIGLKYPDGNEPLCEDTLFYLASVSKQFTAAAIMLLRRQGQLDLEDEITKFFPEIPYTGVTIRHLLTHTGGLPDYMPWVEKIAKQENIIPGNDIIIRFLCECGEVPCFAPGEKWDYSNTGYCLLAEIIEKVSGIPFEDYIRTNIFEPAGMTSTCGLHPRKDGLTVKNIANGYILRDGKYVLPEDTNGIDRCAVWADGMNGCGHIYSTIIDMLKWDRALREETVLTREEQEMMYTPGKLNNGGNAATPIGRDYGFGWFVLSEAEHGLVVSHSGGWSGCSSWYERFVDEEAVMVRLCCRESKDVRAEYSMNSALEAVIRGNAFDPIQTLEKITIKDPDKSEWASYCGRYEHPADSKAYTEEICLRDGELYAIANIFGERIPYRLYPIGEKAFGMKEGMMVHTFGEGCFEAGGVTCKKL